MTEQERKKQIMLQKIKKRRQEKKKRKLRRKIVSVFVLTAIVAVSMGAAYNAGAKEITITEINEFKGINETRTVKTRVENVDQILEECGLSLGEADIINKNTNDKLEDNDDITITRGKKMTIKSEYGEREVNVTKADMTDALVEAGFIPGERDEITANGGDITDSDTIEIVSVSETEEKSNSSVEFETEYISDGTLPVGETKVVSEGKEGNIETVYKVTYRDGQEASREVISETMTAEPEAKVIAKGTATPVPAPVISTPSSASSAVSVNDSGGTINGMKYSRKITMTATAYSTSPSENGGYTVSAVGNPLRHGIVAIDPSVVPLRSKVYVTAADGSWVYGVASAEDTGGAIKGNKIDLCYEGSPSEVSKFGRRSCVVYILE